MWVQLSAGLAPVESCRFVFLFLRQIKKECSALNIQVDIINTVAGDERETFKSVFLCLAGTNLKEYIKRLEGSHLWVCRSPYRPSHKRNNWFIEVEIYTEETTMKVDDKGIKIETFRSGGKGGQNVNKVETAIRIKHLATGITVTAQEERSQLQNKKLALARLEKKLAQSVTENAKAQEQSRWEQHRGIKRGEAVRTFKGLDFKEI